MNQVETLRARVLGWTAAALGTVGFAALLVTAYSEIASKGDPVARSFTFLLFVLPGLLFAIIGLLTGLLARKEGARREVIGLILSSLALVGLMAAWIVGAPG